MVKLIFGLPGCGKTTLLAAMAYKTLKARRPLYKHVLSNVYLGTDPPYDRVTYIENEDLGRYDFRDSLILLDEATLAWDSRDYKNIKKEVIKFFLLHRHYNCDLVLFTQQWDGVDRKIRVITDRVYYMYKTPFMGQWISKYYRIPYGIIIPDPHSKNSGEKLGEIVQGYCKPGFFQRVFCHRIWRPKYYRFFNSWEAPKLKDPPYPIKDIKNKPQRVSQKSRAEQPPKAAAKDPAE